MRAKKSGHQTDNRSLSNGSVKRSPASLVLQDGTIFEGFAIGKIQPIQTGEVVFHTGMSGYQEIMTDPSYAEQIITFTYPHIGSYGINTGDNESRKIFAKGLIIRDYVSEYSNYRAKQNLESWLNKQGVMGLVGLDTRKLTRHIRSHGAMPAAFGVALQTELKKAAKQAQPTDNKDLVASVSTKKVYKVTGKGKKIVAFDFGIKQSIIDQLAKLGPVTIVPANTSAQGVLKLKPDGVFFSNGPGDPSAVEYASHTIAELLGKVPIFGICLGHQLMCLALGAETYKLQFGHHGANHPIKNLKTGQVEITSQNHNYAVKQSSLKKAKVTHVNLNDDVVGGVEVPGKYAFSVQYHPEAGPGPHDASYLFKQFDELMESYAKAN